jgi:hypothetical protein
MFSSLCAGDHVWRMQPAWRKHRHRVNILSGEKIIDIVKSRNAELRGDGVGARPDWIANGDQTGSLDMVSPQQLGVTLGDAPASEQAKSDHEASLLTALIFAGNSKAGHPQRRDTEPSVLY